MNKNVQYYFPIQNTASHKVKVLFHTIQMIFIEGLTTRLSFV